MSRRARQIGARAILVLAPLVGIGACAQRDAARPAASAGDSAQGTTVTPTSLPTDTSAVAARPAASSGRPTRANEDSLRGVIERVGNEPRTTRVIRIGTGARCTVVGTGVPAAAEGMELALWGQLIGAPTATGAACTLTPSRYAVRAVDGIAAHDGVLRENGAAFTLELADGATLPLRDVPMAWRGQGGARVFWAGATDRAPQAYGILAPASRP